jgi:hypothetical protein
MGSIATIFGTSTVSATGAENAAVVGSVTGSSEVAAVGQWNLPTSATILGTATVSSGAGIYASATILGTATVNALVTLPPEFQLLSFMTNVPVNSTGVMSNSPISILGNF